MNEVIMKKCSGPCGKIKAVNDKIFQRSKTCKDGFREQCRNCVGKGVTSHIIEENGIKYQICTDNCKLKLEINEINFSWKNKKNNKYFRKCKICMSEKQAQYYEENKEEILLKDKQYYKENKEEVLIRTKEYYEENKEEISIQRKEHYEENKKEISIQRKEYNSRPEIKKKTNERIKQKALNDPKFKLRKNISSTIGNALKKHNSKKSRSISKSLPYTIDELIIHLETWFKKPGNEWMTLSNQGVYNPSTWNNNDTSTWVWHLDHIIPDIKFNYTSEDDQEFKDCWSLDNLRPLRADLNISEGARRTRY